MSSRSSRYVVPQLPVVIASIARPISRLVEAHEGVGPCANTASFQSTWRALSPIDACACVQGGAAAASGKIQVGDHLVSVGGTQVLGKDIDKVLAVVGGVAEVGHKQRERG